MDIAILMDPLETIKPAKDSTFAIIKEAQARGHRVCIFYQQDLILDGWKVSASTCPIRLTGSEPGWFELGEERVSPLSKFQFVLVRKDPPFDTEYLYSTYLLELAVEQGAVVLNNPRALRDFNEKLSIAKFPDFAPPTLVSRNEIAIRRFLSIHRDIILKPLDGMGGKGIFRLVTNDPNIGSVIEMLSDFGKSTVMAQKYLPEISMGDKRVFIFAGKPVPYALARIPKEGETRANLAAGGTGIAKPLSERDREIADALGPVLNSQGLFLVGIDIIGDYLTEINVTSPTCMQEITKQTNFNVAGMLVDSLEDLSKLGTS
jgi:glutathione synthase